MIGNFVSILPQSSPHSCIIGRRVGRFDPCPFSLDTGTRTLVLMRTVCEKPPASTSLCLPLGKLDLLKILQSEDDYLREL
jgi:hypothetical protein